MNAPKSLERQIESIVEKESIRERKKNGKKYQEFQRDPRVGGF